MARKRAKDRMKQEVNAGSMADIAFLLLIFFLVTTTIDVDKGVLVKLPPWSNEPPPELKLNSRNVYSVLVNANNELLVRGEPKSVDNLREDTKIFIMNPRKMENMAENPKKAIISLKNDRGTSYETYLEVYNELKAAYNELREEEALKKHGKSFEFLSRDEQRAIRSAIPLVISEAEPTNFGDEG